MAPEIWSRQSYQVQEVDIFAIAVIIFILKTGTFPFGEATNDDNVYKRLINDRPDLFWILNESSGKEPFDNEFKDLLTLMLHHQPSLRIPFSDIVFHPWMAGEVAAKEQV